MYVDIILAWIVLCTGKGGFPFKDKNKFLNKIALLFSYYASEFLYCNTESSEVLFGSPKTFCWQKSGNKQTKKNHYFLQSTSNKKVKSCVTHTFQNDV